MLVLVTLVCITTAVGRLLWNRSQYFAGQERIHNGALNRVLTIIVNSPNHRGNDDRYREAATTTPWLDNTVEPPAAPG
jgi:hypothetical protein